MEPPGGTSGGVPCVRVPSVHASWDAGAAGLSTSLSNSNNEQQHVADMRSDSPVAAAPADSQLGVVTEQRLQQHGAQRDNGSPTESLRRPSSSSMLGSVGAMEGTDQQQQEEQSPSMDGDGAARAQLLLWSAAHEIDGRPVTRNGERAR